MNMADLTQLIGSLGFPIVCCIALFYQSNQTAQKHEEEMAKITEAVNNNTLALTKLAERIGKGDDVV